MIKQGERVLCSMASLNAFVTLRIPGCGKPKAARGLLTSEQLCEQLWASETCRSEQGCLQDTV